eukprot:84191-Hanusia_phi.AAC.3
MNLRSCDCHLCCVFNPLLFQILFILFSKARAPSFCQADGCRKLAQYGPSASGSIFDFEENKQRVFCAQHRLPTGTDKDKVNQRCIVPGCGSLASFGYEGGVVETCTLHQLEGHVKLRPRQRIANTKRCTSAGCNHVAAYGSRLARTRLHCLLHKTPDEVSLYAI